MGRTFTRNFPAAVKGVTVMENIGSERMLTRRNMIRWAVGMAACLPIGVGIIPGWRLSGAGNAQEQDPSAEAITVEKWMNEWMDG